MSLKRECPSLYFFFPSRQTDSIQFKSHECQSPRADLFSLLQLLSLQHLQSVFNAIARSFNPPFIFHLDISFSNSDFPPLPHPTHRSMPHLPHLSRRAPSHGLGQNTLIIIVVSASVGGLLLTIIIWRILSRLRRPKSAPLPPRQSLVHQRELQLAAFTEYKDAIVPQISTNGSYIHDSDEATLDSSYGIQLHPPSPHFFPSSTPPSESYSSLPSSNDDSTPSSGVVTPPAQIASPGQSSRRVMNRTGSGPRPLSTFSTNSWQSVRAAPHAPHSNVQIVLPAPLAPSLYKGTASDSSLLPRSLTRDSTYSVRDSWRKSLADSWIVVGQDCLPDSESMERQYGHDSMKRPTRLIRSMFIAFSTFFFFTQRFVPKGGSSPGPFPPRSRSNPTSSSRLRPSSGLDQLPEGTYPPVPHVPSEFGRLSGDRTLSPSSTPSRKGRSLTTSLSLSSTHSHKPRK